MQSPYQYLLLLTLFHILMWLPYILNMIMRLGLWRAVSDYSPPADALSPWAERMKKAHYNAVENYALFAAVTLMAIQMNRFGEVMAQASLVYLCARIVHYLAYTFAIPLLRTLAFFVNVGALAVMLYWLF